MPFKSTFKGKKYFHPLIFTGLYVENFIANIFKAHKKSLNFFYLRLQAFLCVIGFVGSR